MSLNLVKSILLFIILLLVQALVLNHIHLFNCATPLLYVYVVLLFKRGYPRWAILLQCFFMGLCLDLFSNTPGVTAASMTFIGMIQPYVLELFVNRDTPDDLKPNLKSLGFAKFLNYTVIIVLIHNLLFFTLETFSFFNLLQWAECVGGSSLLTTVLVLALDNLRKK